jgi:hypothetical protein
MPLALQDDSIYLAMHSTVLPAPPPAASISSTAGTRNGSVAQPGATGTAEILAGLGIDVDLPNLTGATPGPDPVAAAAEEAYAIAAGGDSPLAQDSEELPHGDETFIEIVEITTDFLVGEHTSASVP